MRQRGAQNCHGVQLATRTRVHSFEARQLRENVASEKLCADAVEFDGHAALAPIKIRPRATSPRWEDIWEQREKAPRPRERPKLREARPHANVIGRHRVGIGCKPRSNCGAARLLNVEEEERAWSRVVLQWPAPTAGARAPGSPG